MQVVLEAVLGLQSSASLHAHVCNQFTSSCTLSKGVWHCVMQHRSSPVADLTRPLLSFTSGSLPEGDSTFTRGFFRFSLLANVGIIFDIAPLYQAFMAVTSTRDSDAAILVASNATVPWADISGVSISSGYWAFELELLKAEMPHL